MESSSSDSLPEFIIEYRVKSLNLTQFRISTFRNAARADTTATTGSISSPKLKIHMLRKFGGACTSNLMMPTLQAEPTARWERLLSSARATDG